MHREHDRTEELQTSNFGIEVRHPEPDRLTVEAPFKLPLKDFVWFAEGNRFVPSVADKRVRGNYLETVPALRFIRTAEGIGRIASIRLFRRQILTFVADLRLPLDDDTWFPFGRQVPLANGVRLACQRFRPADYNITYHGQSSSLD
jgi:hypothetical protein